MSDKLILYGMDISPPVRACKLTLRALKLDYEYKEMDLLAGDHFKDEFLKKNPQHTVPLLEDNGALIWDSHAIVCYLVDKYAKSDELYPRDLVLRARVDQRLFFDASILFMSLRNVSIPFFLRHVSMLPHVSAELFIDVPKVLSNVDFVNLATYDFQTPERDPKVADLPTPLYAMYDREPSHNVQYQVQYWMNQTSEISVHKLHVGVTSYGRAWNMTRNSGITGYPPIPSANGAAPPGRQTVTPGLLSWPEICDLLQQQPQDREVPHLRKVGDPTKRFGIYAYRAADDQGENGLWVGYEDPMTAAIKAGFVHAQGLGGVAFHELSMDDFRGQCAGEKFPILRSIKFKL
ncbi:chitinase-like protein Idgf5 [Drosophila mauritiana]|uniref:Chitinase-like protein Idgf5 n=1 Tax=Drosophila mauritiana TaxID=7226 RepID=A0A6P8JMW6_DROMA|nr:chitinase-like protein Idgf5 [Drosophila mauritiana]